jgi:hypothetical protein
MRRLLAREDPGWFCRECPEKRELLLRQMQRLPVKPRPATEGIDFEGPRADPSRSWSTPAAAKQRDDPNVQLRTAERFPNRI